MTNLEKAIQVFGDESELPRRKFATVDWWNQEYIPPKRQQQITEEVITKESNTLCFNTNKGT